MRRYNMLTVIPHRKGEEVLKKGQTVLKESMEEFSKVIASDKRFKHLHHLDILDKPDPKFEDLLSTVKSAIDQWETRDRKLGRRIPYYFRSFCKHLNAYSNLLSLIPSQSVYCSLISGAIQVIVKVSFLSTV